MNLLNTLKKNSKIEIIILLIAIATFVSNSGSCLKEIREYHKNNKKNEIQIFESFLKKHSEALPENGNIGYISDIPIDGNHLELIFKIQYAFSPLLIINESNPKFAQVKYMLTNFGSPEDELKNLNLNQWELIGKVNDNLKLYSFKETTK
jgi:hypothetical protein